MQALCADILPVAGQVGRGWAFAWCPPTARACLQTRAGEMGLAVSRPGHQDSILDLGEPKDPHRPQLQTPVVPSCLPSS